jgi:hypothetical protein
MVMISNEPKSVRELLRNTAKWVLLSTKSLVRAVLDV